MALLDRAIVRLLPAVPQTARAAALVALHRRPDARRRRSRRARAEREGKCATVDVLGEEITTRGRGPRDRPPYHDVLARIDSEGLDANVSVKLTGLGLDLDADLCRANLESVVADAAARGNFVRIDMEDSSTTDRTLDLYRELRAGGSREPRCRAAGLPAPHVGDCRGSRTCGSARASTSSRPRSPTGRSRRCGRTTSGASSELVEQGAYVGIATHDEHLIGEARASSPRPASPPTATSSRCCSASARSAATSSSGRPPAARLRAVRHAVVRVLGPPAAGEPEDRRLRRRRHGRVACSGAPRPPALLRSQARSEKPPSTTSIWPRIMSASGEQRNATAPAMSSG